MKLSYVARIPTLKSSCDGLPGADASLLIIAERADAEPNKIPEMEESHRRQADWPGSDQRFHQAALELLSPQK